MKNINQFILDGRLVKDVELKTSPNGGAIATYVIACARETRGQGGGQDTDFFPITTYGRQAENDARFLRKGRTVTVIGRIASWYRPSLGKSGFNFDALSVVYRDQAGPGGELVQAPADDSWLAQYEASESEFQHANR